MSGHTPGPWSVGIEGDGEPGYIYCDNALGSAVAIAYGKGLRFTVFSRDEEKANARLIAAAPMLLAFTELLVSTYHEEGVTNIEWFAHEAQRLIAAATGETK